MSRFATVDDIAPIVRKLITLEEVVRRLEQVEQKIDKLDKNQLKCNCEANMRSGATYFGYSWWCPVHGEMS